MKSAIKEIYYGETNSECIKESEEFKRLSAEEYEIYKEFYKSLNNKQKEQFDKMFDLQCGMESESEFKRYKKGFKLGLLLAIETLFE